MRTDSGPKQAWKRASGERDQQKCAERQMSESEAGHATINECKKSDAGKPWHSGVGA